MIKKIYFIIILKICNTVLKGTRFFLIKRTLFNIIGIEVGKGTKIVGPVNIGTAAKLKIGDYNWIGAELKIQGNGSVIVGNNNDFAPNVTILTGSHEIGNSRRRAGKGISYETTIGNGNWIGTQSTIINGANISDGVVIGACTLVRCDCSENCVYVGVPARKVRNLLLV